MSLPRYPEYKDSGVAWLGEVPVNWDISPLKYLLDIQNGADHKAIEQDEGIPVIGSGGQFTYASEYLYDGESVLLGRKGTIDKPLYVTGRFWTVDTMYWSKVLPAANGKFAYYAATTIPFDFYSTSTALPSMTKGVLSAHLLAVPSLQEQTAIATFLDRETAKIDALIAEQEKLLTLLAEKRQATISHAVTKGLNLDVPMKDSGVEWLGEVPADWSVSRIKYLVEQHDGIQMGPFGGMLLDLSNDDTGFKVYGQENTISGDFSRGSRWISEARFKELERYRMQPGDLVLTRKGSLGNARLVQDLPQPGICDSDTIRIRVDKKVMSAELLEVVLHEAGYISQQIALTKRGAILSGINTETIASLCVVCPPPSDQNNILDFLSVRLREFQQLADEVTKVVILLKERRTALISAAVTGKIDVRHLANQEAA